jgi:hypothetical protein
VVGNFVLFFTTSNCSASVRPFKFPYNEMGIPINSAEIGNV